MRLSEMLRECAWLCVEEWARCIVSVVVWCVKQPLAVGAEVRGKAGPYS